MLLEVYEISRESIKHLINGVKMNNLVIRRKKVYLYLKSDIKTNVMKIKN